ncbi:MAG: hypothetical protein Q8L21_00865 [Candidatus Komeilibacteria bacterium]|nr:hypothetical protein [Candidatus Komeilibacteria bacterium]
MSVETPKFNPVEAEAGKTPRSMWAELSKLFHSDAGGETELMQELNLAYEAARDGDDTALKNMYHEWAVDTKQEAVKNQETLLRRMKEESQRVYNLARSAGRGLTGPGRLVVYYKELCEELGITPDKRFIVNFLYDEGWITKQEYSERLKDQFIGL